MTDKTEQLKKIKFHAAVASLVELLDEIDPNKNHDLDVWTKLVCHITETADELGFNIEDFPFVNLTNKLNTYYPIPSRERYWTIHAKYFISAIGEMRARNKKIFIFEDPKSHNVYNVTKTARNSYIFILNQKVVMETFGIPNVLDFEAAFPEELEIDPDIKNIREHESTLLLQIPNSTNNPNKTLIFYDVAEELKNVKFDIGEITELIEKVLLNMDGIKRNPDTGFFFHYSDEVSFNFKYFGGATSFSVRFNRDGDFKKLLEFTGEFPMGIFSQLIK